MYATDCGVARFLTHYDGNTEQIRQLIRETPANKIVFAIEGNQDRGSKRLPSCGMSFVLERENPQHRNRERPCALYAAIGGGDPGNKSNTFFSRPPETAFSLCCFCGGTGFDSRKIVARYKDYTGALRGPTSIVGASTNTYVAYWRFLCFDDCVWVFLPAISENRVYPCGEQPRSECSIRISIDNGHISTSNGTGKEWACVVGLANRAIKALRRVPHAGNKG